jgi:hypothetical protein
MLEQNPIYDFMKSNKLTDLDEKTFLSKYSAADKAKEIHSFFVENDLTDLDSAKFYDKYLKKKELSVPSGEVSSPTELRSVSQDISLTPKTPRKDYYSTKLEKGLIFDKEGQLYTPSSEALSKDITAAEQASLKKSTQKDLVEKSREMPVVVEPTEPIEEQGLLLNLISSLDKSFAKNFISSPIKALGTALQGGTKKVMGGTGEGFISEPLIKLGDYLNKTIDELTPQDEEFKGTLTDQVAQAFGQIGSLILTGGLTGAAGKGAALVSQIPKGSAALTAVKTLGSQLASPTAVSAGLSMGQAEFDRAKEAGATDDQAFEVFYKNAVTGSVLETIPVMQFFKRFNNTTGGSVANYIKTKGVAGLTGGIEEMTTEVMQQLYSNKTAKDIYNINQDILDGVGASGGIGFGVGFVLNAMGANAKILKKQGKPREATAIENQIQQYEDNLKNPKVTSGNTAKDIVTQGVEIGTQNAVKSLDRDLANNVITPEQYEEGVIFTEKAAQVVDKIPETVTGESKVKSVELLVERNDIKQTNDNLIQQKQSTDEAYHAGIDEEIKANEERIKKIDSEVYNIAKKPSKEFGDKKYVVDGEEVSKEAFEALTGKPIGTKEIITAEVKPVEELSPEADIEKRRQEEFIKRAKKVSKSAKNIIESVENGKSQVFTNVLDAAKDVLSNLQAPIGGNKSYFEYLQKQVNAEFDAELAALKEVKPTEAKRIVEPSKPISEMNSEELGNFATETKKALKKQDKDFEGKTEKEKEDGGYYDVIDEVEDLRDASERINFIENAEDVNDLANSVKSTLSNIKGKEPSEYQLAILNAAKNKAIELGIDSKDLIKNVSSKIANQYNDIEDAELMVKSALEKLIPTKKVKPTEVKQEVKVKAPTKELAEGEEVTFNTPEGKKLTGEKITIPGFEKIDMIMVKEGLNNTVYDLASGSELVEGDFSKEGAIESLINQFKEKNITQPKIYGLIYKSTNTSSFEMNKNRVPQINPSSMFESYSEKRKAFDKAEYEKIPLKYTPKEIEDLNKLKNKAIENGLDEVVFDINKRIEERGTENKVNYYDYFDRRINSEIEEKAKKEAEDKGVPYPKKYMKETSRITIDRLKKTINEGFKRDKFESIPEDVRKIMLDGYQKNIDILNKYGYYPDEKTKTFFDKLYQYVAAQTKRENRESQIAEAKKELISALDYLNKAHEKEFGKKAEAEVKPKEGEVKVYNAKDLKANPEVLKEDKDYYSLTYPKSFVGLSTNMISLKNNGFENSKEGDVINIFKKDYVIEGFIENKKNPNETKVKLIRVDKDGNLLREQDLSKKEQKEGKAKEFEEEEEVEVEETEQVTKDDIKKAEAKFAAAEDRFKKARNKIEATQVKQTGMFGGEQKGMFAMGGEEAKSTLDPLRKAAKEAKAELDDIRNRIKVQAEAQPELKPIEKADLSQKDIRKKEDDISKDYYKSFSLGKIKDGSIAISTGDNFSTFKIEFKRQGKQTASPETINQIKKWAESRGLEYTGTSKEDIRETINFKLSFKESPYQKAVKEKLEADKRQNRQIGSEKAAITKEIYRKVNQMDAPADAEQIALRYLADGGKVSKEAIDEAYGSVKRAQLNTGRRELLSEEVKSKDFVQGNETLDETAHRLWEENNQRVSEIDIKDRLMAEIGNNNSRLEAAEAYLDNYNEEYKQEKEELRLAEQYKEEYLEEQEKLEKELREPLSEQIEGEASEEHINNLIDQYEAEIKGEDQQFGPASEGEVNKEASKRKVSEKTQEAELAKEFKEATKKAGKKAKENAKKDYVDRNFEYIKEKIKIEKKCPT